MVAILSRKSWINKVTVNVTTYEYHYLDACLTHFTLVPYICDNEMGRHWFRQWLAACSASGHYLNQYWLIVKSTLKKKLQWHLNQNTKLFLHENAFENVVREMAAILSRKRGVNKVPVANGPEGKETQTHTLYLNTLYLALCTKQLKICSLIDLSLKTFYMKLRTHKWMYSNWQNDSHMESDNLFGKIIVFRVQQFLNVKHIIASDIGTRSSQITLCRYFVYWEGVKVYRVM